MSRAQRQVLIAFIAIACASQGSPAGAKPVKEPHFQGSLHGFDIQGSIDLLVRDQQLNPLIIEMGDVLLQCEDGTTRTTSLSSLQGDVRPSGRFAVRKYYYDSFGGTVQYYLEVSGRLTGERAKGFFYFIQSSSDDSGVSTDCATPRPEPWKAARVN